MADIKVFYFDEIRGRGESICLLLNAAGQKFEDVRIKRDQWGPSEKKESPFGQLPYVIYRGKKHAQSIAIGTFFAKKFGFYGTTAEDALRQEELMHLVEDVKVPYVRNWAFATGEKKAELENELQEVLFPRYLSYFESLLADNGDSGYFVGDSVTLADLYLYDFLETVLGINPEVLNTFPLQKKLCRNVESLTNLKEYLATRPKRVV